jgi:hypothetical protein
MPTHQFGGYGTGVDAALSMANATTGPVPSMIDRAKTASPREKRLHFIMASIVQVRADSAMRCDPLQAAEIHFIAADTL